MNAKHTGRVLRVAALLHVARRHHGGLRLAERAVEALGDDRQKGRLATPYSSALPPSLIEPLLSLADLRDELVDALAHLLVGLLLVAVGRGRVVGHELSLDDQAPREACGARAEGRRKYVIAAP